MSWASFFWLQCLVKSGLKFQYQLFPFPNKNIIPKQKSWPSTSPNLTTPNPKTGWIETKRPPEPVLLKDLNLPRPLLKASYFSERKGAGRAVFFWLQCVRHLFWCCFFLEGLAGVLVFPLNKDQRSQQTGGFNLPFYAAKKSDVEQTPSKGDMTHGKPWRNRWKMFGISTQEKTSVGWSFWPADLMEFWKLRRGESLELFGKKQTFHQKRWSTIQVGPYQL